MNQFELRAIEIVCAQQGVHTITDQNGNILDRYQEYFDEVYNELINYE